MKGVLMQVLSPGAFGLAPNVQSHTERVWFPAGTVLLKVGRGGCAGTSRLMLAGRFFDVSNESFVPVDVGEDGLDAIE